MPIHAFVDESRRGNQYLMAVVRVTPIHLTSIRASMRRLLLPGERELHFKQEKNPRRRALVRKMIDLPAEAVVYSATCARSDERARETCLSRLTEDLLLQNAGRLVLDSRNTRNGDDRDRVDRAVIQRVVRKHAGSAPFNHEHLEGPHEPLLWVADMAAWCWGAGGEWRKLVRGLVTECVALETRP